MPQDLWADLESVDELRKRDLAQLKIGRTAIALTYRDGEFSAISGVCNHVGDPLGEGRLDGDYVVCPWHHYKFHCRTGEGDVANPRYSTSGAQKMIPSCAGPEKIMRAGRKADGLDNAAMQAADIDAMENAP